MRGVLLGNSTGWHFAFQIQNPGFEEFGLIDPKDVAATVPLL